MTRLRDEISSSFLVLPAIIVTVLGLVATALTWGDAALWDAGARFAFAGGPDAARGLLTAIGSSTLTLAGLSFSVTLVVLVLASSQYSPRVLRSFLKDRRTKVVMGIFLGTYVYSLVALRSVRSADETSASDAFVPGITLTGAFLLALASIGVFVFFINHVIQSVRVESIIGRIATDTRGAIDRTYPEDGDPAPTTGNPAAGALVGAGADGRAGHTRDIAAPTQGTISSVDVSALVERARVAGVLLALAHPVGDFVPKGATLVTVVGPDAGPDGRAPDGDTDRGTTVDDGAVVGAIALTATRTLTQDVAFGFRQLVDIAERALSPGINDPTTAVQALDQIHDCLRRLAVRPLGDGRHTDADGILRVVMPARSWEDYVALALDEIRHWGADSIRVHERVGALLDDLLTAVDDTRATALHEQRELFHARARDSLDDHERARIAASSAGVATQRSSTARLRG